MAQSSPGVPPLSFDEQVGQVIVASWPPDPERLEALVARGRVGGILVPPEAALAPRELAAMLNRLQRLASYPLLCACDLAAGPVPSIPTEAALGAARQPDLARRAGALAGSLARALGLHLVLGPVLDVHREPAPPEGARRSFGENPSLAAHLGAAFVAGCQASGALCAGRHFPGAGGAACDAERRLATLPQDRQTLEKIDLLPYLEACRAGLGAIQSGHLHVVALDSLPNRLATQSSAVVEGLLRRTLGFQGLLLSDDLNAPEVAARYAPGQAAVLAFAAGHDLLVTASPEEVYRALYEVLLHGDVPALRLGEAVGRIWAAKAWLGLAERRFVPTPPALPDTGELAREVARSSLTLVRGRREAFAGVRPLVLTPRLPRTGGSAVDDDLRRLARAYLGRAAFPALDDEPLPAQVDEALMAAAEAGAAVMFVDPAPTCGHATAGDPLASLAQELKRAGLAVGVVVMGSPYALARFPQADLLLYLPGDAPAYLEAAFACLVGQAGTPGRLTVSVPGL